VAANGPPPIVAEPPATAARDGDGVVRDLARPGAAPRARPSVLRRAGRRLARLVESGPARIGLVIIAFWVVTAALAPWIAPYSPTAQDYTALASPTPSAAHWLGTDHLGRDLLSRILFGARTVLVIAPVTVLSRVADIVLSFPVIILYMIILAKFGASVWNIIIVLTLTRAPIIYRIVRGLTLELREREYVSAAKMRGESSLYVMVVEILPNARGPLIVDMCLRIGYNTILIGVLGFLGIGIPPPDPDWGGMVRDTYGMISVWPHMALVPCAAISSLVIAFNLLAIGLREIGLRD
jgi:peptide/nickel transport system permease protein